MKKKILFREFLFEIYTDGTIEIDGLNEFLNRKKRAEIMRLLRPIAAAIIISHLRKKGSK